jgi:hypothetical protein
VIDGATCDGGHPVRSVAQAHAGSASRSPRVLNTCLYPGFCADLADRAEGRTP